MAYFKIFSLFLFPPLKLEYDTARWRPFGIYPALFLSATQIYGLVFDIYFRKFLSHY